MAPAVAGLYNQYNDRGLMTLSYMSEDATGGPAKLSDVQAWANQYGQQGIVAFSSYEDVWYPFGVDQGNGSFSIALPGTIFLGPGVKIAKMGVPTPQEIELVLPGE